MGEAYFRSRQNSAEFMNLRIGRLTHVIFPYAPASAAKISSTQLSIAKTIIEAFTS